MKLTEMVISAIVKKGILYEARNVESDFTIPAIIEGMEKEIKINLKAEHMTLRIEKES